MKKSILAFGLSFLLITIMFAPYGFAKTRITITSTGTTSSYYAYWVAVGKAIEKNSDILPTVTVSGGSIENIDRMVRKQSDIGLTQTSTAYSAYNGIGKWKGKPQKVVRWMWSYSINPYVVFVRADSGVKSYKDLEGKKFCAGSQGSGGEKELTKILTTLGIKPKYYKGGYSDAAHAVENRQIAGMGKYSSAATVPDALISKVSVTTALNFLSFSKQEWTKVKKVFPFLQLGIIPPKLYKNQGNEIRTYAVVGGCGTTSYLSQELGYKICKAAYKGRKLMETSFPASKGFDMFGGSIKYATAPLHAGTVQFCKELGLKVPQRLIPPEYK